MIIFHKESFNHSLLSFAYNKDWLTIICWILVKYACKVVKRVDIARPVTVRY